jgi:hypothetical protein
LSLGMADRPGKRFVRRAKKRYATVAFIYAECYMNSADTAIRPLRGHRSSSAPLKWEFVMMRLRSLAIAGVASLALGLAPINSAFARWHDRGPGPVFWPFALGAAVVTGAAIVATAPFRALPPPVYAPPAAYYPPPQAYYAPPAYYPQPGYYAPPPGYYGR